MSLSQIPPLCERCDRPFGAGEGLTLVLSLPKDLLDEPSQLRHWLDRASDYIGLATLLPVFVFGGMGALWWRTGRDPGGPLAVPVRYEPPDAMTPAEMGTVLDERVDMVDITATLLDLAVRGYLRIEETPRKAFSSSPAATSPSTSCDPVARSSNPTSTCS